MHKAEDNQADNNDDASTLEQALYKKLAQKSCQTYACEDVLLYCHQATERLTMLDMAHKRVALEALNSRVTWIPGAP